MFNNMLGLIFNADSTQVCFTGMDNYPVFFSSIQFGFAFPQGGKKGVKRRIATADHTYTSQVERENQERDCAPTHTQRSVRTESFNGFLMSIHSQSRVTVCRYSWPKMHTLSKPNAQPASLQLALSRTGQMPALGDPSLTFSNSIDAYPWNGNCSNATATLHLPDLPPSGNIHKPAAATLPLFTQLLFGGGGGRGKFYMNSFFKK